MDKNILFLGGGRRVELAKRFFDRGYKLFSYELNKKQPIGRYARIKEGLTWDNPDVEKDIISFCNLMQIDLIIPLQDAVIPIAAFISPTSCSANVLAPSRDTATICYDKLLFANFMQMYHPNYYPSIVDSHHEVIIKPRYGNSSKGIEIFDDVESITYPTLTSSNNVGQKFIKGKEYSVDAYFSFRSGYVDSVPRERIRVAGGEVITSKTVENARLQELTSMIGTSLGIYGPANFQYIIEKDTFRIYLLEINCRFGGGSTLSMEAGLNIVDLIENDFFDGKNEYTPDKWKRNLLMERSYRDHYYESSI